MPQPTKEFCADLHSHRAGRSGSIELWLYIAADDPAAADRVLNRIDATFDLLAENPTLGPARKDLAVGLRYFVVGSYLVLYRKIDGGVEIVRVVHGARYIPNLI